MFGFVIFYIMNRFKQKLLSISFSLKVALIFSLFTMGLAALVFFSLHIFTKNTIIQSLQQQLLNVGKSNVLFFQKQGWENLKKLKQNVEFKWQEKLNINPNLLKEIQNIPPGEIQDILKEEEHQTLYYTKESQFVVQILRKIKASSIPDNIPLKDFYEIKFYDIKHPPLIRFAYILIPIPNNPNSKFAMFLSDSDMEKADINNNGKIDKDEEGEFIGAIYNISEMPALQEAITNKTMGCNKDFYRDQWGTFLSCYIPLIDYDKNFLGVLALDFDAKSQYNQLQKIKIYFVLLGLMIAIMIFFSFYEISPYLLKPIKKLTRASIEVANRNYHVKLYTFSNDELGILTKNFNRMVQEINNYVERIEFIVDSFARFVPLHYGTLLEKEHLYDINKGDSKEVELSIMFCDIVNFSSLSEMMSPRGTFEFLNLFFEMMNPIIIKNGGIIDKFIGDEIMAFFLYECEHACPFPLDAAIEMRQKLIEFNQVFQHPNVAYIDMGIGIHYGKVILGTVGSQERLDTTVVGDTVNTASRIQQLTRVFKTPILITDSVKEKLKNIDKYYLRKLQKVRVKGKQEPVQIYECFNVDSDEQIEKKLQTLQKFEEAIELIHNKKIQDAIVLLKEIYQINPEDIVVQVYLEKYERLNSQYKNI